MMISFGRAANATYDVPVKTDIDLTYNAFGIITGRSGTGKSYLLGHVITQLAEQIPVVVFDFGGKLGVELTEKYGEQRVRIQNIKRDGIGINPLLKKEYEDIDDQIERIMNIFTSSWRLGEVQISKLRTVVSDLVEDGRFTLADIIMQLSEMKKMEALVSRLQALYRQSKIDAIEQTIIWDDILTKGQILVFDFKSSSNDTRKIMAEIVLTDLFTVLAEKHDEKKRVAIIIDEAQEISFKRGSSAGKFMVQGRKWGASMWAATQSLENFDKDEKMALQQAALQFCFQPTPAEVRSVAVGLIDKPQGKLLELARGECFITGQFVGRDGTFSNTTTIRTEICDLKSKSVEE